MVQGPTAAELTSEGYLAPARVLAPPGFDSAGLRKRMGDFDTKQAEQRVGTIMGDCLGHYRKHLSGQTAIAFCCSVAHAEAVAHLFQSAGIAAASIDGTMDTAHGGSYWQTSAPVGYPRCSPVAHSSVKAWTCPRSAAASCCGLRPALGSTCR
jgi:hypothetical protein